MAAAAQRLARLRRLVRLLDSAVQVPGTRRRFGLDPLLGLIPGLGDAAAAALSLWIIAEARRLGVARPILVRMVANVIVDTLGGSVPVVGDLFDFGFKANERNLVLLEKALASNPDPERHGG